MYVNYSLWHIDNEICNALLYIIIVAIIIIVYIITPPFYYLQVEKLYCFLFLKECFSNSGWSPFYPS